MTDLKTLFERRLTNQKFTFLKVKKSYVIMKSNVNWSERECDSPEIVTPEFIYLLTGRNDINMHKISDKHYYDLIQLIEKLNSQYHIINIA